MHALLAERGYRVSDNREFFEAPIFEVIGLMNRTRDEMEPSGVPSAAPVDTGIVFSDTEGLTSGSVLSWQDDGNLDDLFADAARVIVRSQQGSVSLLQRKLSVGYTRAAHIVGQLEAAGIVGPLEGAKARQVLIGTEKELEALLRRRDGVQPGALFDAKRAAIRAGAELKECREPIDRGEAECLKPLSLFVPALR